VISRRRALAIAALSGAVVAPSAALAGGFDEQGYFVADPAASAFEPFVQPVRFVPDDVEPACLNEWFTVVEAPDALEGSTFARVRVENGDCAERFVVDVPPEKASYTASVWIRHGSGGARITVAYPEETGLPLVSARMAPTGRATSDGWIELATNELSVDGTLSPVVYIRFVDFASEQGVDLDALELVKSGAFRAPLACEGARDPVCGEDAVCVGGTCRYGALSVPPLPPAEIRDDVVSALQERVRLFFGGRKTRMVDLPIALATMEQMRSAKTGWQFWNGFARGVRELHDWHTSVGGAFLEGGAPGRLNACFIEGDADLTHDVWPRHPLYDDILVSHAGADGVGLQAGDRLVAVDGEHPIAWARKLVDVDWGYHVATDASSFADFAEDLGGTNGTIRRYAKTITVIRCDATTQTCSDQIENIDVKDMVDVGGGPNVRCDNRPYYHLGAASPDPATHNVGYNFFHGKVDATTDEEAVYGMVWDTLYGGGDPNGWVNGTIRSQIDFWKQNARGVILDHRAGNGGTLDAPEYMTDLVRPPEILAVVRMPIEIAAFDGPSTPEEGIALFNESKFDSPFNVGDAAHDPALPVALIVHRDGSASDYMPLGMQGAPKVKLFGPGPTAGAFSTFIQFSYWGGISFQLASGDTISKDGDALIGAGVMPDVVVDQRQSDLLAGVDTIHEAALAWVRQELKP
jgi:hypothetical protein